MKSQSQEGVEYAEEEFDANAIRVNADNTNKRAVALFWGVFATLLIIVLITSNFTPESFTIKNNQTELHGTQHRNCHNPVTFEKGILLCQEFSPLNPRLGLIMSHLSPLNQFAQLNLILIPNSKEIQPLQLKSTMSIELMSLKRIHVVSNNQTWVGFQKGEDVKKIQNISFDTRLSSIQSVTISDKKLQKGYEINLGYYRQFKTQDALIVVTFVNANIQLFTNYNLVLTAILMNDNYTKFIMIMRAVFLGIMAISASIYLYRLKIRNRKDMMPEQSIVVNLSVAVIIFNDPYYFIGVFKPNIISIFVQTIFLALFIMVLFLSWTFMLQKINSESRGEQYKINGCRKWINIIAAIDCFIVVFFFNYQIGYYAYYDSPIIPSHKIFSHLFVVVIIYFSIIFTYILYLYAKILQVWDNIIWRHKLFAVFNIFFVFLLFSFISLGWFSFYDETSQKFQILYASINIYVLYMQFMYTRPFGEDTKLHLNEQFREIEELPTIINESMNGRELTIDLSNEGWTAYPGLKAQ